MSKECLGSSAFTIFQKFLERIPRVCSAIGGNFIGSLVYWVECSPVVRETEVQSQVESYLRLKNMLLDTLLLNTQHYKVRIKGIVEQSGKGVAPSPTPRCGSNWKGSLRVTRVYSRELYLFFTYRQKENMMLLYDNFLQLNNHFWLKKKSKWNLVIEMLSSYWILKQYENISF